MRSLLLALLLLPSLARAGEPCANAKKCMAACNKKDPAGCIRLAEMLRASIAKKKLANKGLKILERACKKGDSEEICFAYAFTLVRLHNMGPKAAHGYTLLTALCELKKHADSCVHLAAMHESRDGVKLDIDKAAVLYDRACSAGHARACWLLARLRERTGRDSATVPDLFLSACSGGVQAGCQRVIAASDEGSTSPPWVLADQFVDTCVHARRHWIDAWWNTELPWPTLKVLGEDANTTVALTDAIDAVPALERTEPAAYLVLPDVDEVAVDVGEQLVSHQVLSATLHASDTGEVVCREAIEFTAVEKLPPRPGPPQGERLRCMVSEQRTDGLAEAMAGDLLAAPWIGAFTRVKGRAPRVRLRDAINKTTRYLDLRGLMSRIEKRLGGSSTVTALSTTKPDAGKGEPADVVGILRVEELSDHVRGVPVLRLQAVLQLLSVETGQIVWLSDRIMHLCADPSERGCRIPGAEVRATIIDLVAEGTASLAVDNYSRCPINESRGVPVWLSKKPSIRLHGVINKTDEHVTGMASAATTALALDGRFVALASDGAVREAVAAEAASESQLGAGLLLTIRVISILDGDVRYYGFNAELVSSTSGEKLWIGEREVKLMCEPSTRPTW